MICDLDIYGTKRSKRLWTNCSLWTVVIGTLSHFEFAVFCDVFDLYYISCKHVNPMNCMVW